MSIKLTVLSHIRQVAAEHDKQLPSLTDDLNLLDSGLDSLSFAVLVARLEDALGVDPFTSSEDTHFPVTLGDFVGAYETAANALAR